MSKGEKYDPTRRSRYVGVVEGKAVLLSIAPEIIKQWGEKEAEKVTRLFDHYLGQDVWVYIDPGSITVNYRSLEWKLSQ